MDVRTATAVAVAWAMLLAGCGTDAVKSKLSSDEEKTSYALGLDIGANFWRMKAEVDLGVLAQGIRDTLEGGPVLIEADQVRPMIHAFQKRAYERRADRQAADSAGVRAVQVPDLTPRKELRSEEERMNYAMGVDIGASLQRAGQPLDIPSLVQGMIDTLGGRKLMLPPEEAQAKLQAFSEEARKRYEERRKEEAAANRQAGAIFLADNAKKPGVKQTESGLQYEVVKDGSGPRPERHSRAPRASAAWRRRATCRPAGLCSRHIRFR